MIEDFGPSQPSRQPPMAFSPLRQRHHPSFESPAARSILQDPSYQANNATRAYRQNYGKIFGYSANRGLEPPMKERQAYQKDLYYMPGYTGHLAGLKADGLNMG